MVIGKKLSLSPPGLFRVQNQQRTMKVYFFALNDRIEYALITKYGQGLIKYKFKSTTIKPRSEDAKCPLVHYKF